jgi:hypothetical protein
MLDPRCKPGWCAPSTMVHTMKRLQGDPSSLRNGSRRRTYDAAFKRHLVECEHSVQVAPISSARPCTVYRQACGEAAAGYGDGARQRGRGHAGASATPGLTAQAASVGTRRGDGNRFAARTRAAHGGGRPGGPARGDRNTVAAMNPLPLGTRVWLAAAVTDMRRGMDTLAAQVQTALEHNPSRTISSCLRRHSRPALR